MQWLMKVFERMRKKFPVPSYNMGENLARLIRGVLEQKSEILQLTDTGLLYHPVVQGHWLDQSWEACLYKAPLQGRTQITAGPLIHVVLTVRIHETGCPFHGSSGASGDCWWPEQQQRISMGQGALRIFSKQRGLVGQDPGREESEREKTPDSALQGTLPLKFKQLFHSQCTWEAAAGPSQTG